MTSPVTGYISFTGNPSNEHEDVPETIYVPAGHAIMISFAMFDCSQNCFRSLLKLYAKNAHGADVMFWSCQSTKFDMLIFEESNNPLLFTVDSSYTCFFLCCFKMLISFHRTSRVPQRMKSGLYNCSEVHFWTFRQHIDCNMKVDCEDGRDETAHCPLSSLACNGLLAVGNKCFMYVPEESLERFESNASSPYMKAVEYCRSLNGSIGVPKTDYDFDVIFVYLRYHGDAFKFKIFWGGLFMPSIYRNKVTGDDNSVFYHFDGVFWRKEYKHGEKLCVFCGTSLHTELGGMALCEFPANDTGHYHEESGTVTWPDVSLENHVLKIQKLNLVRCTNGQFTHAFLSCQPHTVCGHGVDRPCTLASRKPDSGDTRGGHVSLQAVFACDRHVASLHYTLVCDWRQDCQDESDESFCLHPSCDSFTCTNKECVSYSKRCNKISDCLDDSDEMLCHDFFMGNKIYDLDPKPQSPLLISFDGISDFTIVKMKSNESCPNTHYRCPGEHNDCLPVYTRCNGWYDCKDQEDEDGCEDMTCPGFYRCFTSTVCVHVDNLCDGWPHCPQRDDEWLCDMTCPAGCLCQGHAFFCTQPFPANHFPELRYLDGQGSGMTPADLSENTYLVYLDISFCSLKSVTTMTLSNLLFLDLSNNDLHTVNMVIFAGLRNLKSLSLAHNPLYHLHSNSMSSGEPTALTNMDLSNTKLTVFDSKALSIFSNMHSLNLSFSTIHTIHANGFQFTPRLTNLYIESSPVKHFPNNVFKNLSHLRIVSSSTYKLCCKGILPGHFAIILCNAPQDEISSCEDLLQSGTYRAFLWLVSVLSISGNVICFVARVCVQRTASTSGFHVFVASLSVADFLMGVYIGIIGVADELFRGRYLHHDAVWKHSVACKVAGFLSLLSCEVSALTIWLITLDRFIVLRFPFSSVRFKRTSGAVACLMTWLVGCSLALVPLLPVTSHWEFYSQTGICIPLPITRQHFKGRVYSIAVLIVFNFFLFLLIVTGQIFIFWSVRKNALKMDSTKHSQDMTIARRLISVAVTDFLCWFPIGLCGVLALAGVAMPGEINVAFAIFVLPLNSALNPFIYTFNMLAEKRRKSQEAMLLRWLETHSQLLIDSL